MGNELSRSEQKRRMKQLEKLVRELCSLPASVVEQLPCGSEIRVLLQEAVGMKGGARKRQLKFITKLLRNEPVDDLYAFITGRKGAALQESKEFHEIEHLREKLLSEAIEHKRQADRDQEEMGEEWPSRTAEEITGMFPGIDAGLLRRLAWLYARTRNRKHSRELFRIIRAAREQTRLRGNKV